MVNPHRAFHQEGRWSGTSLAAGRRHGMDTQRASQVHTRQRASGTAARACTVTFLLGESDCDSCPATDIVPSQQIALPATLLVVSAQTAPVAFRCPETAQRIPLDHPWRQPLQCKRGNQYGKKPLGQAEQLLALKRPSCRGTRPDAGIRRRNGHFRALSAALAQSIPRADSARVETMGGPSAFPGDWISCPPMLKVDPDRARSLRIRWQEL